MKKLIIIVALLFSISSNGMCEDYDFVYQNETIFANTTWHGKVMINDILTVFEGITLTIEPGTVVMFKWKDRNGDGFGDNEMFVQGEIVARGTLVKPIIFTSAVETKRKGDWLAINMMLSETSRNVFENCIIEYAYRGLHAHFSDMTLIDCELRNNLLALQFQDSKVSIKNCNIHDNNHAMQFRDSKLNIEGTKIADNYIGIRCVFSNVEFSHNSISNSKMTGFQLRGSKINLTDSVFLNNKSGLTAQDSDLNIRRSQILFNLEDGLSLHNSKTTIEDNIIMLNGDDGILLENTDATINNNNIFNNAKYNLNLDQSKDVDAKRNYWGTKDIDDIFHWTFDKRDFVDLGYILVDDYLTNEIRFDYLQKSAH